MKVDGLHFMSLLIGILIGVYGYKWKVQGKY